MQSLIQLDQSLAASFSSFVANSFLAKPFIFFGVGLVYFVPIILLVAWFTISRKASLRAFIAGLLAWEGLSKLIAHLVNRSRPSHSQIGVQELVFHRPDTSFPSDHSAFLMAITVTFYLMGHKKLANWMLAITLIVGITRVGIGVHFPGDIVAGYVVGAVVALLLHAAADPLDRYIIEPLVNLARKFKL